MQRLQCRYQPADAVTLTGGVVLYRSGERAGYREIGPNDRLFIDARYDF